MQTFKSIQVREFRRLKEFDLKLEPLNVMIGANGSGKTSVLEAFSLLAASAAGDLTALLQDMGGADQNRSLIGPMVSVSRLPAKWRPLPRSNTASRSGPAGKAIR
jgi:ABC-type branched-subunit amino acid transport system ATPase component